MLDLVLLHFLLQVNLLQQLEIIKHWGSFILKGTLFF